MSKINLNHPIEISEIMNMPESVISNSNKAKKQEVLYRVVQKLIAEGGSP